MSVLCLLLRRTSLFADHAGCAASRRSPCCCYCRHRPLLIPTGCSLRRSLHIESASRTATRCPHAASTRSWPSVISTRSKAACLSIGLASTSERLVSFASSSALRGPTSTCRLPGSGACARPSLPPSPSPPPLSVLPTPRRPSGEHALDGGALPARLGPGRPVERRRARRPVLRVDRRGNS